MTMNTYEVTNKRAPEGSGDDYGVNVSWLRPHSTIQDWIAAGADSGELEVRPVMQLLDDDDMQHAHDLGLCGLCNDAVTVAEREHWERQEMQYYNVKWDPTIRL